MIHVGLVGLRRGDNRRIAQAGVMGGWDQMRARIKGDGRSKADVEPARLNFCEVPIAVIRPHHAGSPRATPQSHPCKILQCGKSHSVR